VASLGFGVGGGLVSGGHDDQGAEGTSIKAPKVLSEWGMGRGVRSPAD